MFFSSLTGSTLLDGDGILLVGSMVPQGGMETRQSYTGLMQDLRIFNRRLEEG